MRLILCHCFVLSANILCLAYNNSAERFKLVLLFKECCRLLHDHVYFAIDFCITISHDSQIIYILYQHLRLITVPLTIFSAISYCNQFYFPDLYIHLYIFHLLSFHPSFDLVSDLPISADVISFYIQIQLTFRLSKSRRKDSRFLGTLSFIAHSLYRIFLPILSRYSCSCCYTLLCSYFRDIAFLLPRYLCCKL